MKKTQEFTLTKEHLTLLRRMFVRWDDSEFGAPAVDSKRPYGNSDVLYDVCDILKLPPSEENFDLARKLHNETLTALQIILCTGACYPGKYQKLDDYDSLSWKKVYE